MGAIHLNALSSTVPKTLPHVRQRSRSHSGTVKWILMSAARSAADSFGRKKKKKKKKEKGGEGGVRMYCNIVSIHKNLYW